MSRYYLAVDIGASSGRHMLGHLEDGKMHLEEIYRFENGMANKDGKLVWDTQRLYAEILNLLLYPRSRVEFAFPDQPVDCFITPVCPAVTVTVCIAQHLILFVQ